MAMIWRIIAVSAGVVMLTLTLGCIRDDYGYCKRQVRLYITIIHGDNPAVVPDGATVFLFDKDRRYLRSVEVSAERLSLPVPVSYEVNDPPWVVVWGNLNGHEHVSAAIPGTAMEDLLVTLRQNDAGIAIPPGGLYYGIKQLEGMTTEEVPISQKTGRIALTARGLPAEGNAREYYFTVETGYAGYDFSGRPLPVETTFWLPGVFNGNDLVTPQAHNMIHYPLSVRGGMPATETKVSLYKITGNGDRMLASADKDSGGRPIAFEAGKTTNVLLELTEEGALSVSVVITGWFEIYQWDEW